MDAMNNNGLSLYNVGTSLDLEALIQVQKGQNGEHDDSDEGDEEELKQRNAELQDLLTNAFDDLIEEDERDFDSSMEDQNSSKTLRRETSAKENSVLLPKKTVELEVDSLYSPLNSQQDLSETQYQPVDCYNNSPTFSAVSHHHKKHCVRFSPLEKTNVHSYKQQWNDESVEDAEQQYLSSGLNSQSELEILYAARGAEITKLASEVRDFQHQVAMLEGDKMGMKVTLETSERVLKECRDENLRLKNEIRSLNERLERSTTDNKELTGKLEAATNNIVSLERQILDFNVFQANQRDNSRQDVLLSGIKVRYENDLRSLRDELNRVRLEMESKNETISNLETKLRQVTEMHERTLVERAANLQEFNRALDQQRSLREQRDALTSATLLEQLSQAKEEIDRLKSEISSQTLSDSMAQMRLGVANQEPQNSDRFSYNLQLRLDATEKEKLQLQELIRQLQEEKNDCVNKVKSSSGFILEHSREKEKLLSELSNVKELYLAVCKEKDTLEEQFRLLEAERTELEKEKHQLIQDLQESNRNMEQTLSRQIAAQNTNWESKLQTVVQESVAKARLEWLKETNRGHSDEQLHVEKSLGELQCLRETMDALRNERDVLEKDLLRCQQQLKLERHLLKEKFRIEKEVITKNWQEKLAAKNDKSNQGDELIMATADAMTRLRQQCEEEKLLIINSYEKQILELQSTTPTPVGSSNYEIFNWKQELLRIKSSLKGAKIPLDVLFSLDTIIQKIELQSNRDHNSVQKYAEKYKQLKRRIKEYQKYVHSKLDKYKSERQKSEEYCRHVIAELLEKVTQQLQQLELERQTATTLASGVKSNTGFTFTETLDHLQQEVNRYVMGLTNFAK